MANDGVLGLALRRNECTFALFRWEGPGNIRHAEMAPGSDLASDIEKDELELTFGQFYGRAKQKPFLGIKWGKTEAEKLLYTTTIVAWLSLPAIVAMIKYL